jgi:hypothetical protein
MAQAEQAIRSTRRTLDALARGESASASLAARAEPEMAGAGVSAVLREDDDEGSDKWLGPKPTLTLFIPATNCDASASFGRSAHAGA